MLESSTLQVRVCIFVKSFHCPWKVGLGLSLSGGWSSSVNFASFFLFLVKNKAPPPTNPKQNKASRSQSSAQREVNHDVLVSLFSFGVLFHPAWGWASHLGVWNLWFQGLAWCDCIFSPPTCASVCCCCFLLRQLIFSGYSLIPFLPSHSHSGGGLALSIRVSLLKEEDNSEHHVLNYWVCSLLYSICACQIL